MTSRYSTPSPFLHYNVRTGRVPSRPSAIPIRVGKTPAPDAISSAFVDAIVMYTVQAFSSVGIVVHPELIRLNRVQHGGVAMSCVRVVVPPSRTVATGLGRLRDILTSRLVGAPVPHSLEISPRGICVDMFMAASPAAMRDAVTVMARQFVYIFGHEHTAPDGTEFRGRDAVSPFYFSGYNATTCMYIMCYDTPPSTGIREMIPRHGPISSDLWHELYRVLISLAYTGFWYNGTFRSFRFSIDRHARVRAVIPPTGSFLELPKQLHTRLVRALDKGETLPRAAVDSGVMTWWQQMARRHEMDNPLVFLYHLIGAFDDPTREMKRFAMNAWPIADTDGFEPSPAPNTSRQSKNRQHILQIFATFDIPLKATTLVGEGVYGTAYRIAMTPHIAAAFRGLLKSMSHSTSIEMPSPRGSVILKFERLSSRRTYQLGNVVREARTHATVSTAVVKKGKKTIRGRDIAPRLFFSGIYGGHAITCMEYIKGDLLTTYILKGSISRRLFQAIEHMVETMLRIGVVHGDMHGNNVIVTPSGQVKCIDFGFAFEIPDAIHRRAVAILDTTNSIERAWLDSGLQDIVDARYFHQKYYHSNLKLVQYMATMVDGQA